MQLLEGEVGLGQVRLQDDPRAQRRELRLVEDGGEGLQGEAQVSVLLHVEVDEGLVGGRGAIERAQLLRHARERSVPIDREELTHDRRELDGDVIHVGAPDDVEHARQPVVRLALPEYRFAEHVDVEAQAVGRVARELLGEGARIGVQDQVLGEGANLEGHHAASETGHRA